MKFRCPNASKRLCPCGRGFNLSLAHVLEYHLFRDILEEAAHTSHFPNLLHQLRNHLLHLESHESDLQTLINEERIISDTIKRKLNISATKNKPLELISPLDWVTTAESTHDPEPCYFAENPLLRAPLSPTQNETSRVSKGFFHLYYLNWQSLPYLN